VNEHHYAVVVGINRYPGLSDLRGARADAGAFADWLERPDGGAVPPANVNFGTASATPEWKPLTASSIAASDVRRAELMMRE
jgi:hypothetical protein